MYGQSITAEAVSYKPFPTGDSHGVTPFRVEWRISYTPSGQSSVFDIDVHAHSLRMVDVRYPPRGKSALRIGRTSEPGRVYLVTFVTMARRQTFLDWNAACTASLALQSKHVWRGSSLLCWVLMPDHWHGMIELGDMDSLSSLVGRVKGTLAHAVNAAMGSRGSVWDVGFHDRALRSEDDALAVARYIVLNPVRAGLVPRVGLYPFWDAVWVDQGAA
ncbi:transposase [Dokdonella sp.]|uniref:REP-associated tyrosine transposase n=1 Tax=Dokdonella sp. TaxID=2291710 RepID=UPI0025BF52EF|nr:transposase [Dokdonella sp.]